VIAIMSYNGRPLWWPSRSLRESIACPPEWLHLAPDVRYLLFDQLRVPEEKLAELRDNATAALTRLEASSTPEDLFATLEELAAGIVAMGLGRPMGAVVKAALMRLGVPEEDIPASDTLLGSSGMLVENLLEWKKNYTASPASWKPSLVAPCPRTSFNGSVKRTPTPSCVGVGAS
jgi:hypothetical protein